MPLRNLVVLFTAAVLSLVCYERAARNRYVGTLTEAMNIITQQYIDEVDSRVLFDGAMDGMVKQLDPYSGYTSPAEYEQLKETIDQEFGGVGIVVEINADSGRLTVMSPLIDTPAYKAGLKSGDVIMGINGEDTLKMTLRDAVEKMRGPEGSDVKVAIQHAGETDTVEYTLQRAIIPIESVLGDTRHADGSWSFTLEQNPRIGYIRLVNFGERTTEELRSALHTLTQPKLKIDGLIIDLRGNAGGLLKAAVETCDMFLDSGVIVSTRGRGNVEKWSASAEPGKELPADVPMVVLVDKYSASASEIVAACLQDQERAKIAGQRSWGKGTVQNIILLEGARSALRLTVASYWRPSGKNIHKKKGAKDTDEWGVRPDPGLEVNLTDKQFEQVFRARRLRDMSLPGEAATETKPPVGEKAAPKNPPEVLKSDDLPPVPTPDAEEGIADAPPLTTADDPQLKRAVEYLKTEIRRQTHAPQRA
jgi:carboxyl-terminal processing protease